MAEEVDNFLEHFGVAGMKWGKRKAAAPSTGPKNPSYARAALLGAVGNGKGRFSDPKALKQRTTAGKLFVTSIASNLASTGLKALAEGSNNSSIKAGADIASNILNVAGAGTGLASLGMGIYSVTTERAARNNKG